MPAKMHPPSRAWPAPTDFRRHRELLGGFFEAVLPLFFFKCGSHAYF